MAQIKYIKKQAGKEAKDDVLKPKANTKAKVTKPAPAAKRKTAAAADKKKAVKAPAKKTATKATGDAKPAARGRPKKADTAETDGEDTETKQAATKTNATSTKKAPAKKTAAPKKEQTTTTTAAKPSRKRKAEDDAPAAPAKKVKVLAKGKVIAEPPTQRLNIYVFGEGTAGELALGTAKKAVDVKRPRLNPNLSAKDVGIVQVEAGGMHCIALTHDNKILTWGVNDQGTLGRNTDWEGGLRDMDDAASDSSDDEKDDNGLNPKESTPGEVDWSQTEVPEGTRFVQVAAGDSSSFVLTDDGKVYGWGTFRSNDGIFGFTPDVKVAFRPVLIPTLKDITSIKAGANHALAMNSKGAVFAWGSGQQNQLGRRIVERTKEKARVPCEFGLPKSAKKGIAWIETGSYHSFAIAKNGDVYAWGLNNFGETGVMNNAGQDEAVVMNPTIVKALQGKNIISIKGGSHHTIAATDNGECLAWGRIDGCQTGIPLDEINKLPEESVIKDPQGRARILAHPQKVSAIQGDVVKVTAASDHNIAITKEGKAWSWGFSANYQTGQGTTDDVDVATLIDNTATRDQKLNGSTSGGQFSIVTSPADVEMTNA